jgi:heme/copper-type cytochrome/quinol oxidase subunit 4
MAEESTNVEPKDYSKQVRQAWVFGGMLAMGAAITTAISYTHAHIGIALLIAAVQVSLQTFVMMHLKNERGIIFKFLVFTVFFVIALFVLTRLHESDPLHSKLIPVTR